LDNFGARFGQRILDLRTNWGESQEDVALGAFGDANTKTRISELENGKVMRPQAKTVNALCAYFNISPAELADIRRPKGERPSDTRLEALEHYANQLKRDLEETRAKLAEAEGAAPALSERADLLEDRLADPESALSEAEKTVEELRALLERDSNELGGPLLTRARDALEHLDYSEAEAVFEEIEDREAPGVARAARAAYARGVVAELDIRWADAAKHFGRAAGLNPTDENLSKAGYFAWKAGQYDAALGFAGQYVKLCRASAGKKKETLASALTHQALYYHMLGLHQQAEPLFLEALEIDKATIGRAHPEYAVCLNNLASLYQDMGRYDEAELLFLEALEIDKATIGTAHPNYASHLNNLAPLYRAMGLYDEAEPLYLEALEIDKATIGTAHPGYAIRLNNLAELYRVMGRYDEAEPLYLEAQEISKATLGTSHPDYATRLNNLARLYEDMGRIAEAIPLIEEALSIFRTTLGEVHPNTQTVTKNHDRIAAKLDDLP